MEEDQWQPPTNNGRARKIVPVVLVVFLIIAVGMVITISVKSGFGPGATPTPTPTPTASIIPSACEIARDSTQAAIDAYHAEHGEWPTTDGQPGDIDWDKLVPAFMDITPSNDASCEWRVNSDPEGEVCVPKRC